MFTFAIIDPFGDRLVVKLSSQKQDDYAPYVIEGDSSAVRSLRDAMEVGRGAFGHSLKADRTSADDIHAFLVSQQGNGYRFSVVGKEVGTYTSPSPGKRF
jgi:hypothetical protein